MALAYLLGAAACLTVLAIPLGQRFGRHTGWVIWGGTFLGEPEPPLADNEGPRIGWAILAPAALLAMLSLALGLGGQGLLAIADVAAEQLRDPSLYLAGVLNR